MITMQEMLDSGKKDWQYVIGPPVMSGIPAPKIFYNKYKLIKGH
jgi:hypothetical protein